MLTGQLVGSYRIDSELGKGGMGAVYAATDSRDGRESAVKVLTAASMADPERRKRFEIEARTTAALDHPNIVRVHEVGSAEVAGQRVHFMAMERVRGQTLERWIGKKGLPLPEVLRLGAQIASALAAAHAIGIVHRDLKPSNVMVTEAGDAKVLDFGLAKWNEPDDADISAETRTMRMSLTQDGTILGTVSYMSPEQAEGKRVDGRSDVFSFGSLLYEMVTGRQAFTGDSKVATLSAILAKEPPPLGEMAAPPEFRRLIERCLRKDPERRIQSMADVRVELEDLAAGERLVQPPAAKGGVSRRAWIASSAAGAAAGMIPGAWITAKVTRREAPRIHRLTFRRGDILTARFAPGGAIVYSAAWDNDKPRLYMTQPGGRESRPLDLPPCRLLSISKKGEMALLMGDSAHGNLARAPFSGGAPREIYADVTGADWGPDGESLCLCRRVEGSFRIEYPAGNVIHEAAGAGPETVRVSPDGSLVAFWDADTQGDFAVAVVGRGHPKRVLSSGWRGASGLAWREDGGEVWFAGVRLGEDIGSHGVTLSGKERVVSQFASYQAILDVSPSRDVLIAALQSNLGMLVLAPGAKEPRDLAWLDASLAYDMSADGSKLLFLELSSGRDRNASVYLRGSDGSPAVDLGVGNRPALSPDGQWVACLRSGATASLGLLPVGPGQERAIPAVGYALETVEWFPDGQRLLVTATKDGEPGSFAVDIASGEWKAVARGFKASRVSPDGRWLTAIRKNKLELVPLDGGAARVLTGVRPGDSVARWSGDGKSVFLSGVDRGSARIEISRVEAVSGQRTVLHSLEAPPGTLFWGRTSVSADGRCYAKSFRSDKSNLYLVKGLS